jgi:hypothetical protein
VGANEFGVHPSVNEKLTLNANEPVDIIIVTLLARPDDSAAQNFDNVIFTVAG